MPTHLSVEEQLLILISNTISIFKAKKLSVIATITIHSSQPSFSSHPISVPCPQIQFLFVNVWETSVKTFIVKFTEKTKFIFQSVSILMDFQIIYCICSLLLLFQMAVCTQLPLWLSIIIALPTSPKFQQLFFSFWKVLLPHIAYIVINLKDVINCQTILLEILCSRSPSYC